MRQSSAAPRPSLPAALVALRSQAAEGFTPPLAFPLNSASVEDALQEPLTSFVAAPFAVGEFGFGRDEVAFDGGFQDGGLVALEICLDAF